MNGRRVAALLCAAALLAGCGDAAAGSAAADWQAAERCLEEAGATVQVVGPPEPDDTDAPERSLDVRLGGGATLIGYYDSTAKAEAAYRDGTARSGESGVEPERISGTVVSFPLAGPQDHVARCLAP